MQAFLAQLLQAGQRLAAHQQLEHFVEHARGRHVVDQRRHHRDRRAGGRLDRELQLGGEAHHAQHAHRVFAVARFRLPMMRRSWRGCPRCRRGSPAPIGGRVVVHGVDGEVAPHGVFVLRTEGVVAQDAAMLVLRRVVLALPRKVVTSSRSWPNITCTIWKRRPMMKARRNSF
jgi:hypothetical protein